MDLSSLNSEQKEAVIHEKGPLLIIAGAGTGKTTVITKKIQYLILEKNISPSEILALTFTEKAAREMEERIDVALPYGYTQMWISTFHAFCDRILRDEALHIGLNPAFKLATESESMMLLRKNLFQFNLSYFRPLGNPFKFLGGLLQHFNRLKDDDITPEQYLAFAGEMASKLDNDPSEVMRIQELAQAYKHYEELKIKEGIMDFSDLNAHVLKLFRTRHNVLSYYQDKFKYILVDEFQDTNYAQNELAMLLAGKKQNITVVGDDDQCLVKDTIISTPKGGREIQYLKEGDSVYTGVGRGAIGISRIKKVFKSSKETIFVTIKTKSGKTITATANHKLFCYIPKRIVEKKFHYVYLMHNKNLGWRLGTTYDLAQRLKLERSADAIIGLRVFSTLEDALYHETIWSLTYQIPTCVFKERNSTIMQGKLAEKLFAALDTDGNAKRLAADLGVDLTSYHSRLDAVTRGRSQRIKIHLSICDRNYKSKRTGKILINPSIFHKVDLETSNHEIIELLTSHNIPITKTKKGIRIRKAFTGLSEADDFAKQLVQITGGFIEVKSCMGILNSVSIPALVMPAGNVIEGGYLPIEKDNTVYYDEITSISRERKKTVVYDLEIEKTHNFIANDIIVHNSIYRWRGAALANIIQFREHFPKAHIVALTKNYRSTAEILNAAYTMIQHNNPERLEVKEKINKRLEAMRGEKGDKVAFLFGNRVENEADLVVEKIRELQKKKKFSYKDFAILVRANDHAQPFTRALERAGIPYQFLGPGHLFHQEEIKDLIAYLKVLYNFEDSASMYRVLCNDVFQIDARDIAAILIFAKKKNLSLFEAAEQINDSFLRDSVKQKITDIVGMIKKHLKRVPHDSAGQILYYFLEDSGLLKTFIDPKNPVGERRAQNIAKFFEKLKSYEAEHEDSSIFAVVDWIDLALLLGESPLSSDSDWSDNDAVNILTVHSSKGLEFPVVFVVNLVTQRFPSRDRKDQIPVPEALIREGETADDVNISEERRLFYVAMTRARDYLFLTAANFYGEGKRERKLSPFIMEALGEEYIKSHLAKEKARTAVQQLSLLDIISLPSADKALQEEGLNYVKGTNGNPFYPVNYISYSQIQTFEMCPLHYKLKYILKIPPFPSPALSFGSSIHAVLRDYYAAVIKQLPPEEIAVLLKRNWIAEGYTSKSHAENALRQAEKIISSYLAKSNGIIPSATEIPFQFYIKNMKVGGRIDRVDSLSDGRIEIIDYKTGLNVPDEKKLATDMQLTMYALAATEVRDQLFNKKPDEIQLSLHYVEAEKNLTTTRTLEQLKEVKEYILQKAEEISKSDFQCSATNCKNCEYSIICQTYSA